MADDYFSTDPVAARTQAFSDLLATIKPVKDRELRDEAMLMLRAVRMSFKTEPQGQLVSIKQAVDRSL
jgi:hypothetical protein